MPKVSAIDKIIQPFNLNKTGTMAYRTVNGKVEKVRDGKTARDKANGHIAYKKNRRIWSDSGKNTVGQWVKV
ncbi:hypothetical protein [Herbiconiux daphne]|uniref:Uncharacterized protein n=1 Tax=Herbiconiux daphne TaxID=2970914 RepID=A0ABT2HAS4_9MICO|nr:hypothetical protein [Herbiconiux daphne]MCS5737032.1 hypothetical protein [Herbiconiux daphne]